MIEIEELQAASMNAASLQYFLSENFEKVYDLFSNKSHSELTESRERINRYIQLNRNVILELDISVKTNLAFITLLIDISEQLGLLASFRFLYKHLEGNNYNIGERLKAAALYLIGIKSDEDYTDRYADIYNHLKVSFETEEDNADKVLMTFLNYYALVINNFGEFNPGIIEILKGKIKKSIAEFEYSFLHNSLIADTLEVDLTVFTDAYTTIHSILDSFLGRDRAALIFKEEFLLEAETEYCELLHKVETNFKSVRDISVKKYHLIQSDSIFYSLGRGVAILTEENQLFAYMNSYGNMHYEKLISSFNLLSRSFFQQEIDLIDWGCGQAMASMTYFDFLNQNGMKQKIKNVTLIEPSEIALKRASLHINKFHTGAHIHTTHKYLDSLLNEDFRNNKSIAKLHLFSNILDINQFSLTHLLQIIDSNFSGDNYFICVSPYINDIRTSRLDAFMNFFSKKHNFEIIKEIDNASGEWRNNWTRVIRVFRATLE